MKVIWTDEALSEIENIIDHIAADDPGAAYSMAEKIFSAVENNLPDNPKMGRPGRVKETRELVAHISYIVVYRISGGNIEILTVRHAARLWPDTF